MLRVAQLDEVEQEQEQEAEAEQYRGCCSGVCASQLETRASGQRSEDVLRVSRLDEVRSRSRMKAMSRVWRLN